ncbi:hypothetical protein J3D55_001352 [Chryseobacterium ginsenosidimutans]|uniref:hypothetical protein n=1 Tax=Chryseobacterium ginsenosidimutans TaxID=687846 RepID=UPI002167B582|nr:hypothetical protein [Chryseobacterium ginsenosidimutans]MCS3868436.1 hypothetical protein [Chryseobacterium ginsenosidimutans]
MDAAHNRVGVGMTNPQANFHVKGTRRFENATAGSVTVGSVLSATDTNGTAEWKTPATETIVGALTGNGIDIPFVTSLDYKYTGRSIVLPPGKWAVTITQLTRTEGTLGNSDWLFVRSTFSDQNIAVGEVGTMSSDLNLNIGPTLMSFRVKGFSDGSPQQFDVFQGTIIINNTSGGNKTYRYMAGNTVIGQGNPNPINATIKNFGGAWAETNIYATAIK